MFPHMYTCSLHVCLVLKFLFCLFEKQTDLPASASFPRRPQQPDAGQAEARATSRSPQREARAQNASQQLPPPQADQQSWGPAQADGSAPLGGSEVPFPRTTGRRERGLLRVPENPGAQSLGLLGKRRSRSTCLRSQGWAHGWLPGLRGPRLWRSP